MCQKKLSTRNWWCFFRPFVPNNVSH